MTVLQLIKKYPQVRNKDTFVNLFSLSDLITLRFLLGPHISMWGEHFMIQSLRYRVDTILTRRANLWNVNLFRDIFHKFKLLAIYHRPYITSRNYAAHNYYNFPIIATIRTYEITFLMDNFLWFITHIVLRVLHMTLILVNRCSNISLAVIKVEL